MLTLSSDPGTLAEAKAALTRGASLFDRAMLRAINETARHAQSLAIKRICESVPIKPSAIRGKKHRFGGVTVRLATPANREAEVLVLGKRIPVAYLSAKQERASGSFAQKAAHETRHATERRSMGRGLQVELSAMESPLVRETALRGKGLGTHSVRAIMAQMTGRKRGSGAGRQTTGISWQSWTGAPREWDPQAFFATMASGHKGVFKRRGKARLPIYELYGPSIPLVATKSRALKADTETDIPAFLERRLASQTQLIVGARGGRGSNVQQGGGDSGWTDKGAFEFKVTA